MTRWITVAVLLLGSLAHGAEKDVHDYAVRVVSNEKAWQRLLAEPPNPAGSRDLFSYALALCEADQHLDRLPRVFELAARMQDRDPSSRSYGNFRWSWNDAGVLDWNAVDFCLQTAALLWARHAARLPAAPKAQLAELIKFGLEGLMRHRVPVDYTNIVFMNAGNLIVLGELFDRPEAVQEGLRRLDRATLYIWQNGVHEYDSPTYYGVDLDDLGLILNFAKDPSARRTATALSELFWTDLAANWFQPADRLAGSCSRDYDYLRGLGYLDDQATASGWRDDSPTRPSHLAWLMSTPAPARLRQLNRTVYPRWVRQSYGESPTEAKSHYVLSTVTLGSSSERYHDPMDIPLALTFAGPRQAPRGYVISDGRHDPYGKLRIPVGGGHEKTVHLKNYWTAAQDRRDAIGLTLYRDREVLAETQTLETHFVLPRALVTHVAGEAVKLDQRQATDRPLAAGQPVILRQGRAIVGLKLLWARDRAGQPTAARLIDDQNNWGVVRLTVQHQVQPVPPVAAKAGAAFWVRVDEVGDDQVAAWIAAFAAAQPSVAVTADHVKLRVPGLDGPVAIETSEPYADTEPVPAPYRGVLELNGQELSRPLLDPLPAIQAWRVEDRSQPTIAVQAAAVKWGATDCRVAGEMVKGQDPQVGGFVWMPGAPGERGGGPGFADYRLQVARAGTYWLWCQVWMPTPDDDSFLFQALARGRTIVAKTAFQPGVHKQWEWVPLKLDGDARPTELKLPAGEVHLQFHVREDGAKLGKLWLTADPNGKPE